MRWRDYEHDGAGTASRTFCIHGWGYIPNIFGTHLCNSIKYICINCLLTETSPVDVSDAYFTIRRQSLRSTAEWLS